MTAPLPRLTAAARFDRVPRGRRSSILERAPGHPRGPRLWRALAILGTGLLAASCARVTRWPPPALPGGLTDRVEVRVRVGSGTAMRILSLPLEAYVGGVVFGEVALGSIPPATASAVAQLQAILARTYAVAHLGRHASEGFDLCADAHCQVYVRDVRATSDLVALVRRAVEDTRGLVVTYQGRPIEALYHADCGGRTSDAAAVWGHEPVPYLKAVADPFCRRDPAPDWRFETTARELGRALGRDDRTRIGPVLRRLRILRRDGADRVVSVALDGDETRVVRGEDFRAALARGFGTPVVRSARFRVSRHSERFVFTGRGAGHGVGVCQAGARARLMAGLPIPEVLRAYYPGTRIDRLGTPMRTTGAPPGFLFGRPLPVALSGLR